MIRRISLLILLGIAALPAWAEGAKPSDASVRQLLTVSNAEALLEQARGQVGTAFDRGLEQGLKGLTPTPAQQQVLDDLRKQFLDLMDEELSWKNYEPIFLDIYARSLTQEEVDGMLAFYSTPAGKAVIAKMPTIMQLTMESMQQRMSVWMPKLVQLKQDAVTRLKAAESTETKPAQ